MTTDNPEQAKDPKDMTDAELTDAVAVGMGWHLATDSQRYINSLSWFDSNGRRVYGAWNSRTKDGKARINDEWLPLTNWNHTMQVALRWQHHESAPLVIKKHSEYDQWLVTLDRGGAVAKTPQRAICEAALLAFRSSHD